VSERDKTPEKPAPAVATEEAQGEPFLKRWSRLKQGEEGAEVAGGGDGEKALVASEGEAPEIDPADLPDIESLDKDSDYTPFMQEGVPEALRTLALRQLFFSDPALAVLDGLNDYDEDFSMLGIVAQKVRTAYKAGRGFLEDDDLVDIGEADETEEVEAGDGTEAPAAAAEAAPDPPDEAAIAEEGDADATSDKHGKPTA
jgi:Protein of unknown function (DUF3306)